jgi:hypothetical protein
MSPTGWWLSAKTRAVNAVNAVILFLSASCQFLLLRMDDTFFPKNLFLGLFSQTVHKT